MLSGLSVIYGEFLALPAVSVATNADSTAGGGASG
jgi:hypothetical protein